MPRPQIQRFQDLDADLDLFDGGADNDTRMVSPIPLESSAPKATADLIVPERLAPLGHSEMQRVIAGLGQQLVSAHHDDRVVVLDGDLEIPKSVLLEEAGFPESGLDQRLRGGFAVLGKQPLVERPALTPIRIEHPAAAAACAISFT